MHTRSLLAVLASAGPALVEAQLHSLAKAAGLEYFGTAVGEGQTGDSQYMSIASDTEEFGQLVPENGQKWDSVEPNRGQFNYNNGDIVPNVAARNDQILRCHTLTWHSQLPGWGMLLSLLRLSPPHIWPSLLSEKHTY
jgi:endo-1,4-beta-xylanase